MRWQIRLALNGWQVSLRSIDPGADIPRKTVCTPDHLIQAKSLKTLILERTVRLACYT
jgi:hypothetical protein